MKDYFEKIYRAIDYAEEQIQESIEVKDLSREAGVSLFHFSRLFKTVTGETPSAYIRKRKLSEARDEILNDKEIIHTAFNYGWNSQESFTHAFSKYFRTPPGKIRKSLQQPIGLRKPIKHKERYIFMNGTQIWKIENLAQQMYSLSQAWAHESVNLGPLGRGLNIVASETKKLYRELIQVLEKLKEGKRPDTGNELEQISEKIKILTLNSTIEAIHTYEKIGRPSLISANELKQLNYEFNNLIYSSEEDWLSGDVPEVLEVNTITNAEFYFLKFNLQGLRYCENMMNIKEIFINRESLDFTDQKQIDIRGVEVPLFYSDTSKNKTDDFGRYMLVIGTTLEDSIAVPVDYLRSNDIFISPLGIRNEENDIQKRAIPLRESWKSKDKGFIDFINWNRTII